MPKGLLYYIIFIVIILGIFISAIVTVHKSFKKNNQYAKEIYKKYHFKKSTPLVHVSGLPVSNWMQCGCFISDDKYIFIIEKVEYVLDKIKITNISLMKDIDIQKQAISNSKGVVTGAALLGAAGAIMAKGSKVVDVTTVKQLIIFDYIDENGEQKQLVFDSSKYLTEKLARELFKIKKETEAVIL